MGSTLIEIWANRRQPLVVTVKYSRNTPRVTACNWNLKMLECQHISYLCNWDCASKKHTWRQRWLFLNSSYFWSPEVWDSHAWVAFQSQETRGFGGNKFCRMRWRLSMDDVRSIDFQRELTLWMIFLKVMMIRSHQESRSKQGISSVLQKQGLSRRLYMFQHVCVHSLKLTAKASENRPFAPKGK